MTNNHPEREPRYSLKTLQALYDGATNGRLLGWGELRLTITDEDHHTYTARVLSIGSARLTVQDDDGTVHWDVKPSWVEHAEVV
jgi:hypothetical protein